MDNFLFLIINEQNSILTIFGTYSVDGVVQHRRGPLVHLVGRGDALERVLLHAPLLHQREVALERRRHDAQQLDQRVAQQGRIRGTRVEHFFGGSVQ